MSTGNILFRYRSLRDAAAKYTKRIICGNELFFANPLTFNDPFDCRPVFAIKAANSSIKSYYASVLKRQAPHLNRVARRTEAKRVAVDKDRNLTNPKNLAEFRASYDKTITSRIGMLCLSELADDPLMWSHYSDAHRGVCLAFDWRDPFFAKAQPVQYQVSRPTINPVFHSNDEMLEHALLTKSSQWNYEREWRIVHYRAGAGSYPFPPEALVGVILGAQISAADRELVKEWLNLRNSPIKVFEASLSTTEFKVHVHPPISET